MKSMNRFSRAVSIQKKLRNVRRRAKQKISPPSCSVLVLGGCRSGKTAWAEARAIALAEAWGEAELIYIATAEARDDDAAMRERIARHQAGRDARWRTVEAPLALPEALKSAMEQKNATRRMRVILIDCVTVWLSNLMAAGFTEEAILSRVDALAALLARPACPVFAVSNEVGLGVAPSTLLGNGFRDIAGLADQRLVKCCAEVYFIVSGLAQKIKPMP